MSAYHFISFTMGIQFVVSINWVWKPTQIFNIKGNFSYCIILTKCSVTCHGQLWAEHFRCFVTGHWLSWTLDWVDFAQPCSQLSDLTQIWPWNEQFGYLSHSNTVSGSVHKHPMSHPVNNWSKWYSIVKWDVGITIFIVIVQNKKIIMFHVSGDIQRYLQDFKKVSNNAELKYI